MKENVLNFIPSENRSNMSFQWELWGQCNNHCDFCMDKSKNRRIPSEEKISNINNLLEILNSLDYNHFSNISLRGGDFFQGEMEDPEVNKKFFELIQFILDKYTNRQISSFWLLSTLIIGDQHDLYKVLDMFERAGALPDPSDSSSGLWICTSWDSNGRFHTPAAQKNWEYHMKNIHEKYPWVKFNTTMILQQDLLEKYLNDEINFTKFQEEFNTSLFFKTPIPICSYTSNELDILTTKPHLKELVEGAFNEFKEKGYSSREIILKIEDTLNNVEDSFIRALFNENKKYTMKELNNSFFPKRETFISFLGKLYRENPSLLDRLWNIQYRADFLGSEEIASVRHKSTNTTDIVSLYCEDNSTLENKGNENSNIVDLSSFINKYLVTRLNITSKFNYSSYCNHGLSESLYSDSDDCLLCDIDNFVSSVYGY